MSKSVHHRVALEQVGDRLIDRPLPVAVAQDMDLDTACFPGLAMRRIADAASTVAAHLRSVDIAGPAMADLAALMGYDDDLRDQVTAGTNRIRNLLLSIRPALERTLGADLANRAALGLLAR